MGWAHIFLLLLPNAMGRSLYRPEDAVINKTECGKYTRQLPRIAPPIFSHNEENLSFNGCGIWNRSEIKEPPWNIALIQDENQGNVYRVPCRAVILSDRTLLSVSEHSCSLSALLFEKGFVISMYTFEACPEGKVRDCLTEKLDKKVLNVTRLDVGGQMRYLWTVEKINMSQFLRPICLFNNGSSDTLLLNDLASAFAKIGNECFPEMIFEKQCPILNTAICSDGFESDYVVANMENRFYLRALNKNIIPEPMMYNGSPTGVMITTRHLFSDIVSEIPKIVDASLDLAMMPPASNPPKVINFSNQSMGPSFPDCGLTIKVPNGRSKRDDVDGYIHKGEPATRGWSPWHASLSKIKYGLLWRDFCGATLISERAAITAAHCLYDEEELIFSSQLLVSFGAYDQRAFQEVTRQTIKPDGYLIYPRYRHSFRTFEHDIALIIFSRETKVQLNDYVRPACLWNGNSIFSLIVNKTGMVTGWGLTDNYTIPDKIQTTDLRIASYEECYESNKKMASTFLKPAQNFCAGHPNNGTNVCNGDSGSGLIIQEQGRFYLRGIVSFGPTRKLNVDGHDSFVCNPYQFSFFTDITFYLEWIVQNVPDLKKPCKA